MGLVFNLIGFLNFRSHHGPVSNVSATIPPDLANASRKSLNRHVYGYLAEFNSLTFLLARFVTCWVLLAQGLRNAQEKQAVECTRTPAHACSANVGH